MPNFKPIGAAQEAFLSQIEKALKEQLKGSMQLFDDLNLRTLIEQEHQKPIFDPAVLDKLKDISTEAGKLAPGIGSAIGTIVGQGIGVGGDLVKMYQAQKSKEEKLKFYHKLLAANLIMRALYPEWESRSVNLNEAPSTKNDVKAEPDQSNEKSVHVADEKAHPKKLVENSNEKIAQIARNVAEHLTWRFQHILDSIDIGATNSAGGDVFTQQICANIETYFVEYADGELVERLINASTYKPENGQMQAIEHLKKANIFLLNDTKGNLHSMLYLSPVVIYADNSEYDHNKDKYLTMRGHEGSSWRKTKGATAEMGRGEAFVASFFHLAKKPQCRPIKYAPLVMYKNEVTKVGWSYGKDRKFDDLPKTLQDKILSENNSVQCREEKVTEDSHDVETDNIRSKHAVSITKSANAVSESDTVASLETPRASYSDDLPSSNSAADDVEASHITTLKM